MFLLRADEPSTGTYTGAGGEGLPITVMVGRGRAKVGTSDVLLAHTGAVLGTDGSGIVVVNKRKAASVAVLRAARSDDGIVNATASRRPVSECADSSLTLGGPGYDAVSSSLTSIVLTGHPVPRGEVSRTSERLLPLAIVVLVRGGLLLGLGRNGVRCVSLLVDSAWEFLRRGGSGGRGSGGRFALLGLLFPGVILVVLVGQVARSNSASKTGASEDVVAASMTLVILGRILRRVDLCGG